jgi:hypothetical protein
VDISPRKKLIHTMPPNTDRPINRAMVVGCAVSATRNHLKLHKPRRAREGQRWFAEWLSAKPAHV